MARMLRPLGQAEPYFSVQIAARDGTWSAKVVFIAANAWGPKQAAWLDGELSHPTTYTFIVRHERTSVVAAPGVGPSRDIIRTHPYTLIIVGHTHTLDYLPAEHELVVGNGGAPLVSAHNYGYVIARQQEDGSIAFAAKDYATGATVLSFSVGADGSPR